MNDEPRGRLVYLANWMDPVLNSDFCWWDGLFEERLHRLGDTSTPIVPQHYNVLHLETFHGE